MNIIEQIDDKFRAKFASDYCEVVLTNGEWQQIKAELAKVLDGAWQPIETAPKDGTHIMLYGDGRVTEGNWLDDYYPKQAEFHCTTGAYIGQFETGECIKGGWMSFDGGFSDEYPATHWMPLPSAPIRAALAEQPALATCKSCNGNDGDAPCAYPGEGKHGCLRDARLALAEQDDEAVARVLTLSNLGFSTQGAVEWIGNKYALPPNAMLYTRPAPKTYTESDIDVAIGAIDWANTSWQQAAVEAKKLVMRFVGSQVTMDKMTGGGE